MTRRILQIIPTLVRGGAEKQMTLLATGLPRDGFEVHVCTLTSDGPYRETLEAAGIPIHSIHKQRKLDPSAFIRLRKLIRELKPDLVHTWIFAANSYGRYAALKEKVPRIIAGERCVDPWKRWHELAIDRYLVKRTDGLVTNSSGVVEFYASKGIDRSRFTIIPNGIELPATRTTGDLKDQLTDSLGIPRTSKLIGTVGRLWPQKRIKDLIWAADLLKCVRDDVHLLIVGDGPLRWRLEKYRNQVEIADRVHFLGERDDAQEIIGCLDCFWLGSEYEGQSNALMEAMAAGIPSVVSDIPGNRDLVQEGKTGYLVKVGDRAGFASRTEKILNEPTLAGNFSRNAVSRIKDHFSTREMVKRYGEYYASLFESPGSTG